MSYSASATKRYSDTDLPRSAVATLFLESVKIAKRAGFEVPDTVQVFISRSGGINEHADWPLDKLFAVTNLSQEGLNSIRLTARGPSEFTIELSRSFGSLSLMVIAPTVQAVADVLALADQQLPAEQANTTLVAPSPRNRTAVGERPRNRLSELLDWFEKRPVYRVLVIIGAIGGGVTVIIGILRMVGAF